MDSSICRCTAANRSSQWLWYKQNELITLLIFFICCPRWCDCWCCSYYCCGLLFCCCICVVYKALYHFVIFITLLTTQLFHDWLCIKNVFRLLKMLTVLLAASYHSLWFYCCGQKRNAMCTMHAMHMYIEKETNDRRWDWKTRKLKSQRKQFALRLPTLATRTTTTSSSSTSSSRWSLMIHQTGTRFAILKSHCCGTKSLRFTLIWRTAYNSHMADAAYVCVCLCVCVFNPVIDAVKHTNVEYSLWGTKRSKLSKAKTLNVCEKKIL